MSTSGLDLVPEGDGFMLSVTDTKGNKTEVHLTPDQVLTLAQSAPLFRERVLSERSRKEAGVEAVFATHVAQVGLNVDMLNENILLTMIAPNDARMIFELPIEVAHALAQRLPDRVRELLAGKMEKQ